MRRMIVGIVAASFGTLLAGPATGQQRTIDGLRAAYRNSTSAALRYAADGRQAQKEGRTEAAKLFRAVCQSEIVHSRNYVDLLAKLGVHRPEAGAYTATTATTTQANLEAALKQEETSRDELLPRLIEDARAEHQTEVETTLNRILLATGQHAKLYAAALADHSEAPGAPFYICPMCGGTYSRTAPARMPTCGTPRERLLVIK